MKSISIIVLIFLSISCSSVNKDLGFTGDWILVRSNNVFFNVCPKVKLVEINRVIGAYETNRLIDSPLNKVVFSHGDEENYFSDTSFYFKASYENGSEFLELISLDKGNNYLLARTIKP